MAPHIEVYSNGSSRPIEGTFHRSDDVGSAGYKETTKLLTRNLEEEASVQEVADEYGEVCIGHTISGVIFHSRARFQESVDVE